MQVLDRRGDLDAHGAHVVVVGFSPPDAMAALAGHLALPWPVLSDPDRLLYRRLQIRRAPLRDVYSPGTLARYAAALARGYRVRRPVEDTRQMGADAIVVQGHVVRLFRPRTPDDRPSAEALLTVIREVSPATP